MTTDTLFANDSNKPIRDSRGRRAGSCHRPLLGARDGDILKIAEIANLARPAQHSRKYPTLKISDVNRAFQQKWFDDAKTLVSL